jgi:hypothetical protein
MRSHSPLPYLPDLVEAAVLAGRQEVAARGLASLESRAEGAFPRRLGAIERCRALVAEDAEVAIAHLERAAELEGGAGVPFERARSQLLLAERMLRARRRGDASEPSPVRSPGSS